MSDAARAEEIADLTSHEAGAATEEPDASRAPDSKLPDAEAPRRGELIAYVAPVSREYGFADAGFINSAARGEGPTKSRRGPRDWRRLRAAASLAAVVAIGAAAAAEHVHVLRVTEADQAQTLAVATRLDGVSAKLEASDLSRSRDELAGLRKVLAEIKSGAANTRDAAVAQLNARVDRLERDQSARLDKLAERIDHDATARLTDLTTRLDKMDAKATAISPAKPTLKTVVAKVGVSDETTAAAERPAASRLRRFALGGVRNGYAMIYGPAGEFVVAPGDFVPGGGGRVLRFERRGRDWAVVTTEGQIVASEQ